MHEKHIKIFHQGSFVLCYLVSYITACWRFSLPLKEFIPWLSQLVLSNDSSMQQEAFVEFLTNQICLLLHLQTVVFCVYFWFLSFPLVIDK